MSYQGGLGSLERNLGMNKEYLYSKSMPYHVRYSCSYELEYSSYPMVYDIDHRPCFMMLAYELEYSSSGNDMTYILVYSSYSIMLP